MEVFIRTLSDENKILQEYYNACWRIANHFIDFITAIYDDDVGVEILARKNLRAGLLVYEMTAPMIITNKYILQKYASFIWYDKYIYPEVGLLLNNADCKHPANCDIKDSAIFTKKEISAGECLRIDYQMEGTQYPPIPEEIINIRKNVFCLK